ncbi:MAG: sigma-70 family RNA polymerase sigma factor [Myxococcales bacterium FL481]|nr:MAG: sigma-70 family RNA polymerase sigma factor [Myxococcales bacterium FL481]
MRRDDQSSDAAHVVSSNRAPVRRNCRDQSSARGTLAGDSAESSAKDRNEMQQEARPMSFREFYKHHYGFVQACVRHRGVQSADVEDVTQEVFSIAHRKGHALADPRGARRWLSTIARYCALNWNRQGRRADRKHRAVRECPGVVASPSAVAERLALQALIRRYLSTLNERQLQLWVLAEFYQLSANEIADVLDMNPHTVRSALVRARGQVRACVRRLEGVTSAAFTGLARQAFVPTQQEQDQAFAAIVPLLAGGPEARPSRVDEVADPFRQSVMVEAPAMSRPMSRRRRWWGAAAAAGVTALTWGSFSALDPDSPIAGTLAASTPASVQPAPAALPVRPVGAPEPSVATTSERSQPRAADVARLVRASANATASRPTTQVGDGQPGSRPPRRSPARPSPRPTEQALIDEALRAEASQDYARALELCRTHRQRYRNGQLAVIRAEIHVRVLCRQGQNARARRVGRSYQKHRATASAAEQALASPACVWVSLQRDAR